MSFFSKMFFLGMCSAGLTLATAVDAEAGHRHRHRRGGCCASQCAPVSSCNTGCGATYAAPVSNGCCTTNGAVVYGGVTSGDPGYTPNGQGNTYGQGNLPPAPGSTASPSDLPAGAPPMPSTTSPPPVPAPPPAGG